MTRRWAITLVAVLATGCLRTGEERANADLEIGEGESGGVTFRVHDGLATVRSDMTAGLTLWSQSPVLRMDIEATADAPSDWGLEIQNCMPGSVISTDAALTATPVPGPRPTVCRWNIELSPGQSAVLDIAPPDAALADRWRLAVMGDIQQAIDTVDDLFVSMNADPAIRMVVCTGDLVDVAERGDYDPMLEQLEVLDVPFYSTVGNHELYGDEKLWREYFGRHTVNFWFKGVAFSLVDSANAAIDPTVYGWLDDWLDDARDDVHLFFTHFPPLDPLGVRNGSFRSRKEANKLLARLAAGNVDVTFYGHIHSLYVYENAGIPAYISGGGGAWPERWDGIDRHYLVVDLDPDVRSVGVVRVD